MNGKGEGERQKRQAKETKKAKSIGGKLRQGVIMVRRIDESYLNE